MTKRFGFIKGLEAARDIALRHGARMERMKVQECTDKEFARYRAASVAAGSIVTQINERIRRERAKGGEGGK